MRVERYLADSAAKSPDKLGLVVGEDRLGHGELEQRANRLARALRDHGLARGDRAVIFLENSPEAFVAIFAILKTGGVFSLVNPTTKADKLAYILNNSGASAILTAPHLLRIAAEAISHAPSVRTAFLAGPPSRPQIHGGVCMAEAMAAASPAPCPECGMDSDLGMIVYTSGSTGLPKGVMMTHQNMDAAATSITTLLQNAADDVILSVLPLSFNYGLYQAIMAAKARATLILEKGFAFPEMVVQKLRRERVTGFPLVPTIASILLQMKSLTPGSFPDLRYITNTAASLPPAHIQRLQEIFSSARIYSMYGLTECKRATCLPPEELRTRPTSVGKAIPNTEVWIVDEKGERVGPGVVGELVVRGPHVMQGYWDNPEASARVLRPGSRPGEKILYTGDLFVMDEEGFLYFKGRKDDIIKSRGEKVSPKEVENVLYALRGVSEAVVVGVPDPVLGMSIKAIIVPAQPNGLTVHEVLRHCAVNLEDYMVPKHVEFRSELPKTSTGKIRRGDLQAEALASHPSVDPA